MSQKAPPGPEGPPIIGNLIPYLTDRLEFIESCADYGDVVHRTVHGNEAYLLFHPDHIERVMVDDDDKFAKQTFGEFDLDQSCGNPFVSPENHPWEDRVRILAPAFGREHIDSYIDVMAESTDRKAAEFEHGEPVDVLREMEHLVNRMAVDVVFGKHGLDDVQGISDGYHHLTGRLITRRRIVPLWAPTPGNWKAKKAADYLIDTFEEMIEAVRADDDPDPDNLLSVVIENADEELTTEYLRNEILILMGGAHETTGLALTFMWYLVAKHPDVQQRIQQEVDEVVGDDLPEQSDLSELSYTEKVIKESLRLYPPVYLAPRTSTEEITIDGYTIPPNSRVILPQWVVQRDERWYDDPDEFRPERWTPEFEQELPDMAYFPFSGGPKRCLGRAFGRRMMQIILATVMRRADVELHGDLEDLDLQTSLTLKPKDTIEMIATPRT